MEVRHITQYKMYFLVMNPVYSRCEDSNCTVVSYDRENLIKYYNNQRTESYKDDLGYTRFFKEGPLFDYNPLYSFDVNWCGQGIVEMWVDEQDVNNVVTNKLLVG